MADRTISELEKKLAAEIKLVWIEWIQRDAELTLLLERLSENKDIVIRQFYLDHNTDFTQQVIKEAKKRLR